jgi:hypothetical protein
MSHTFDSSFAELPADRVASACNEYLDACRAWKKKRLNAVIDHISAGKWFLPKCLMIEDFNYVDYCRAKDLRDIATAVMATSGATVMVCARDARIIGKFIHGDDHVS